MWKCDRKIWRGKGGKLYEDGDPRAQVLVATPGDELESKPSVEKLLVDPSSKALKKSEDKAVKPSEDKGRKASKEAPEPFPQLEDEDEAGEPES